MSEASNPLEWARYAEEDWEVANLLSKRKRIRTTSICFHAQQSAEKYLRALLISKKTDFPKTLDPLTLNSLCSQGGGGFTNFSPRNLAILTDHAVSSRYSGEEPSVEDAKESISIAKSIRNFSRAFFRDLMTRNSFHPSYPRIEGIYLNPNSLETISLPTSN